MTPCENYVRYMEKEKDKIYLFTSRTAWNLFVEAVVLLEEIDTLPELMLYYTLPLRLPIWLLRQVTPRFIVRHVPVGDFGKIKNTAVFKYCAKAISQRKEIAPLCWNSLAKRVSEYDE